MDSLGWPQMTGCSEFLASPDSKYWCSQEGWGEGGATLVMKESWLGNERGSDKGVTVRRTVSRGEFLQSICLP